MYSIWIHSLHKTSIHPLYPSVYSLSKQNTNLPLVLHRNHLWISICSNVWSHGSRYRMEMYVRLRSFTSSDYDSSYMGCSPRIPTLVGSSRERCGGSENISTYLWPWYVPIHFFHRFCESSFVFEILVFYKFGVYHIRFFIVTYVSSFCFQTKTNRFHQNKILTS